MSDNKKRGAVVIPLFGRPAASRKDECLSKARKLMLLADGTNDLVERAKLLQEASDWLEKAEAARPG
jgi:hypothetical protein